MRNPSILAFLLAGTVLFGACGKDAVSTIEPRENVTEPVLFTTRAASSSAFENGDRIGLYALAPINARDAVLIFSEGEFSLQKPLYWAQGQESSTTFVAYYPFGSVVPIRSSSFRAAEDQSEIEAFRASDLLGAVASASPEDRAVSLEFQHFMSRLSVKIENSGSIDVSEVRVSGVKLTAMVDILSGTSTESSSSATDSVRAFAVGDGVWEVIVAPQTTVPEISVVTEDDKTHRFVSDGVVTFSRSSFHETTVSL